jgi:hypothetical protein
MDEKTVKVAVLENEIESQMLASILDEQEIPHIIQSYHDAAYDGLFQMQKGWGYVVAPESCKSEILEILEELRESVPDSPPGDANESV